VSIYISTGWRRCAAARSGQGAGLIGLHRAGTNGPWLAETAEVALAFWMLHEAHAQAAFLAEVVACLGPSGRLLVVEP